MSAADYLLPPINTYFNNDSFSENIKLKDTNPGFAEERASEIGISAGLWDSRKPISEDDSTYNAVGRMFTAVGACTATIIDIEGYETDAADNYILTAAHCDNPDLFWTTYVDQEGSIHKFHSMVGEPLMINQENDTAIYALRETVPADLVPMTAITNADLNRFSRIDAVGLSSDKAGLTGHFGCVVTSSSEEMGVARCDAYSGASGGPSLKDDVVIGVNNAVVLDPLISSVLKMSTHGLISSESLNNSGNFYRTQTAELKP